MNEIELLESLLATASKVSYENQENFDGLRQRTKMIVRKLFGDESHYLKDLDNITYHLIILSGDKDADFKTPFDSGLKQFRNLIQVMIEDKQISSNL